MKLLLTVLAIMFVSSANADGASWLRENLSGMEKSAPHKINEYLTRQSIRIDGDTMVTTFVMSVTRQQAIDNMAANGMTEEDSRIAGPKRMKAAVCAEPFAKHIMRQGAKIHYIYKYSDGPVAYKNTVSSCDGV